MAPIRRSYDPYRQTTRPHQNEQGNQKMPTFSLKLQVLAVASRFYKICRPEAHIQYSDNRTTRNNKMDLESKTIGYLDYQSLPWLLRIHSSFIVPSGSFSVKTHNLFPLKALVPQYNFNIRVQISK